ncbi:hypothetical protein EDD85DRAFT_973430 [Armillaria nabsnona]|nr:hypothetical protein EDD85DRAFT_973430 [Armillaria nabsnona]
MSLKDKPVRFQTRGYATELEEGREDGHRQFLSPQTSSRDSSADTDVDVAKGSRRYPAHTRIHSLSGTPKRYSARVSSEPEVDAVIILTLIQSLTRSSNGHILHWRNTGLLEIPGTSFKNKPKTSIRDSFQDTNAGHGGSDGEHRGNAVRLRLVLRQVSGEKYEGTVRPSNRFLPSESSSPKKTRVPHLGKEHRIESRRYPRQTLMRSIGGTPDAEIL